MYGLARLPQQSGRRFGAPEDLKDAMSGEQLTLAGRDIEGAVKKNENESKEMLVVLWLVVSCCFAACL